MTAPLRTTDIGARRIVYAIVFLAFLDTFALLPVLGPYAIAVGAGPLAVGLVVGGYSASGLVFNVVGGQLADRLGRRPLALAGGTIAVVAVALYGVADSASQLVGLRLLHGAGGGLLIPAVFTIAGDLAPPSARGRVMGRVGALIGLAAVVGPGVAGPLRGVGGFGAVFALVAAALTLVVVLVAAFVPETGQDPRRAARRPGPGRVRLLLGDADLALAVAAVLGFTGAFGTLVAFLPTQVEAHGASPALAGLVFVLISGVAAALMLSPAARWVDRSGPVAPVAAGMGLFAAALGLLALDGPVASTLLAATVFGVGFGLLFPAATGTVAITAPATGRGLAFGLFYAAYSVGFVVVPPVAGALVDGAGLSPYVLPMAVCGLVLAAALRSRTGTGQAQTQPTPGRPS